MRKLLDDNLKNITISTTLVQFGNALVTVFIPLLLLQSGLSLTEVCLYFVVYAVFKLAINYPAMLITNRWGAKISLMLSNVFQAIYLILLVAVVNGDLRFVWLVAAFTSLCNAFAWNAYHLHVSRVINNTRKGQDIATIESIGILASSIAPAVAAVLATMFNHGAPLAMAVVIVLLANYWLKDIDSVGEGHKRVDNLKYSLQYAPKRDIIANIFHNTHGIIGKEAWAIYLALTLASFHSIAAVTTIAALISAVFLIFVGMRNDKKGTHKVLQEGAVATSATHLLRLIPASFIVITVINIIWMFTFKYQKNPWTTTYYAHTRNKGINYILSMEIGCDISYVLTFGLIFAIVTMLGDHTAFPILFIVGAVAAMGTTLITPAHKA